MTKLGHQAGHARLMGAPAREMRQTDAVQQATMTANHGGLTAKLMASRFGWNLVAFATLSLFAVAAAHSATVDERAAAAGIVASTDPACTSLTAFYWEIGDGVGLKASGQGGSGGSLKTINATTTIPVASASKWVFASMAVEQVQGQVSDVMAKALTMSAGYVNFNACSTASTVDSCLSEPGAAGGTNGDYTSNYDGYFYYGGGHMQVLGDAMGYGPDTTADLTAATKLLPNTKRGLTWVNPQLAGGLGVSVNGYTQFLRNLINGSYTYMNPALGSHAVCTHTNGDDCPTAYYSPINNGRPGGVNNISDEHWHYSLGHWVEDDPTVGDGAFSSPGKFGFYPWVDAGKQWYGVIARYDMANVYNTDPQKQPYYTSVQCGRKMRAAWIDPTGQGLVSKALKAQAKKS
ncbi:hypothetical protein LRH25_15150 [Ideonella azotifigens]|uniref:Uncharacterized protein n=1 Tax=Ideonella azotifigens TaxID=513160 RepID=A0ABP3V8I4_9BURK|nr:hypothetical protein [Ideonella azotifigens]MCD2341680.1 hypothetical protein [Ideonella azotifigens]